MKSFKRRLYIRKSIVRLADGGGFTTPAEKIDKVKSTELLFKGRLDEIRLIGKGIYLLSGHKYYIVNAYDGQHLANGKKRRVAVSTEETDNGKALLKANEFVNGLKRQWIQKYGESGADSSNDSRVSEPPEGSIQKLLLERLDILMAELGDGCTLAGYLVEGRIFLDILGSKRARWSPARLTPELIQRIVKLRLRRLDPSTNSQNQCTRNLRYVLKELTGFKPEWLKLIKAERRKRGLNHSKRSDDFPFLLDELKKMHDALPKGSNTAVGLYHLGSSGAMNPGDAANSRWAQFDEAVEAMAEGRRMKNGNPFCHGIWPELLAWIKCRKREAGDIYIFPDLIFTAEQRKDPRCNKTRLSLNEEKASPIKTRTWAVFHEFLLLCGITRQGVSFRSFRSFNCSELFAAGYPVHLLKAVTGHDMDESFFKYVHVLPRHIRRIAEYHRRFYQAVVAGKELPVYLTHTEVVEALTSVAAAKQAELERFVTRALDRLEGQIKTELRNLIATAMNR